jgi:PTS system fructose-specific IIA component
MTIAPDDIDRLTPPDLVTLEEPPTSRRECVEFLLDVAVDAGRVVDRERALADLLRRAADPATAGGVGMGIGVSHATTAGVSRASIVFGRSEAGVDFDAVDGDPAHLLFVLAVPDGGDEHRDGCQHEAVLLEGLSRTLLFEEVRESLRTAGTVGAVRDALRRGVSR